VRGYAALQARREERTGRIRLEDLLPAQEAEERAQGGELSRGGALLETLAVKPGQERADEEVIDVARSRLAAQLAAEVGDELLEVVPVRPNGMGRRVALPLEMAAERGQRFLNLALPPSSAPHIPT
jgi:hypothetical protein